jgi:hypothetical protein
MQRLYYFIILQPQKESPDATHRYTYSPLPAGI